jgi:hypothetical protein
MNVEIGTEAAPFPEKEYIHKWDFRCSAGHAPMAGGPVGPIICAEKLQVLISTIFSFFRLCQGSQFTNNN